MITVHAKGESKYLLFLYFCIKTEPVTAEADVTVVLGRIYRKNPTAKANSFYDGDQIIFLDSVL